MEIKVMRDNLAEKGLSEEDLSGVVNRVEQMMADKIDELTDELLPDGDEPRQHEQRNDLHRSLSELARRIDRRYQMDVRSALQDDVADDDAVDDDESGIRSALMQIHANNPTLQFINLSGNPILQLPPPPAGEGEGDATGG